MEFSNQQGASVLAIYSNPVLATCISKGNSARVLGLHKYFFLGAQVLAGFAVWIRTFLSFSFPCLVSFFIVSFHLGKQDAPNEIFLSRSCPHLLLTCICRIGILDYQIRRCFDAETSEPAFSFEMMFLVQFHRCQGGRTVGRHTFLVKVMKKY